MKIFYRDEYDIDLGILNFLHPFDGRKFSKIFSKIKNLNGIIIQKPNGPVNQGIIEEFVGEFMPRLLSSKRYILRALEVPYIPLLPFSIIDNRILLPMRWAVSGTIEATNAALSGDNAWNLSGGYHHASRDNAEGFCIYNDIGIAMQQLIKQGKIGEHDKIIIIDVDAHHGNGNAYVFLEQKNVSILDIYNNDIYPANNFTKTRVNISIPLRQGTSGEVYLSKLDDGLNEINTGFKLAFVVAGTDVLASDPLGGLGLSVSDCVTRDKMVLDRLQALSIPAVFLGAGGYGKDSAMAIAASIANLYQR